MRRRRRVLVTGGAGFLGSHLCARLLREGHHVICLDDFSTGSTANLTALRLCSHFEVVEHDVVHLVRIEAERIYNLACPASPRQYQRDPHGTTRTAVLGAMNVLALARETGARVLQASTSEVYGDPTIPKQPENYRGNVDPLSVRACYEEGKRCAETLFFDAHRHAGTDIRIARIFNTFGPRMRAGDGRVVPNLVSQALRGAELTVHGSGLQTRSFCYVDDLIDGLVRLMETADAGPRPINLGNPEEVTIRRLAEMIRRAAGTGSELRHRPADEDDPMRRRPDIARARTLLGWAPRVDLATGLARTVAHARDGLAGPCRAAEAP